MGLKELALQEMELGQRRQEFYGFVRETIGSNIDELKLHPPTQESLDLSARIGVEIGRKIHTEDLGRHAITGAYEVISDQVPLPSDQQSILFVAVREGYEASSLEKQFKYVNVTVDFDN